ncbi:MAG: TonB-dependent receptor [Chitinophagaceae bacterium]|nr:TonB-dependent receptor [Chitinophagaceae bacterium]
MQKWISLFAFIVMALGSNAQNSTGKISVTIKGDDQPLENATVYLLDVKDSSLVKLSLTNKSGVAEFENILNGKYIIKATNINFEPYHSAPFTLNAESLTLPLVELSRAATQMQSVTVKAQKPFIQKLTDRIVVNVENSIVSAGSTAMDILERSPGVSVDQNESISLRGRSGVIIMIDGKPTPMAGNELAAYLRGLPSSAIERIDLITNPSAKYEAAGNSGIIDIRLKKDQRLGMNGTLNASYGQGVYPKANAGGSFNYRNKTMNIFGSYNHAYRENLNHLVINRNFYENGTFRGSDDKDNYAFMPVRSQNMRLGTDFFPSKKTTVGFVLNANTTRFTRRSEILTMVNDVMAQPDFKFLSFGSNNDRFTNGTANINFKHQFDSLGKELTADADYGIYQSRSLTRTASSFYELNGTTKKEDDILDGDQDGDLRFQTAKVDYVNPLKKGAKLEIGYKTSKVSSDNDAKFYNVYTSGSEVDDTKTNRFFYTEYNNAAYANYSREFTKFNFQVGLRSEQTDIKTRQVKANRHYNNEYFELFPSAFFNYKLKEDKTLGVSVSRRIDRPGYNQLNPFLFQVDATIYATGDPHLKPQMTWSYEMSYTMKNINFNLGYSHSTDPQNVVLSRILDVIPTFEIKPGQDSNITVQIPVNLESSDYFGLTATVPVRISKWWNMINNVNIFYNHFNANLGGVSLNNGDPAARIRTNNNFILGKGWTTELNANFNTGGRSGYMLFEPNWGIDIGAQKTIFDGKGAIRLNVTDIFWTNLPNATITYEGRYVENWHAYRESRVATLSINYRFGNNKVQAARNRTTASEEERRRAQ